MEGRNYGGRLKTNVQDGDPRDIGEAYSNSLSEDWGEDFRLPINHRPMENLDMDNLEQASLDTQLTSSNIGYRLLQKMGWKGKGLGKDEQARWRSTGRNRRTIFHREDRGEVPPRFVVALVGLGQREAEKIRGGVRISASFILDFYCKERFKEMREMHGSSSRDDRQKREQLHQEKEMAKFAQMADAHKQQQQQEQSGLPNDSGKALSSNQNQRRAFKFEFSRLGASKNSAGSTMKKQKVDLKVPSVFGNDSDEEP